MLSLDYSISSANYSCSVISILKVKQWIVSDVWQEKEFKEVFEWIFLKQKNWNWIDIAGLYETRLAKENPNAGQVQYR